MKLSDATIERFYSTEAARADQRIVSAASFLALRNTGASLDLNLMARTGEELAAAAEAYGLDPDDMNSLLLHHEPLLNTEYYGEPEGEETSL